MLTEMERRFGMSPNITHGDLAPDMMSSTKLRRVSATDESPTCSLRKNEQTEDGSTADPTLGEPESES